MTRIISERRAKPRGYLSQTRTVLVQTWRSETTVVRFIMAWSSLLFAIGCWWLPDWFKAGPYGVLLDWYIDSPIVWGGLFFLSSALLFWRLADPVRRIRVGKLANGYWVFLWFLAIGVPTWEAAGLRASFAVEYVIWVFGLWALYKTGASEAVLAVPHGRGADSPTVTE